MKQGSRNCILCGGGQRGPDGLCLPCAVAWSIQKESKYTPSGFAMLDAARARASLIKIPNEAYWGKYVAEPPLHMFSALALDRWWECCERCLAYIATRTGA